MVAFRAVSAQYTPDPNGQLGSSNVSVAIPTCSPGDLLLAFLSGRSAVPTGLGWAVTSATSTSNGDSTLQVGYRYATASDSGKVETWRLDRDTAGVTVLVYSNPPGVPIDVPITVGTGWSTPNLTPSGGSDVLLVFAQSIFRVGSAPATPSGLTARTVPVPGDGSHHAIYERTLAGTGSSGSYAFSSSWAYAGGSVGALLLGGNAAPSSPTLLAPVGGVAVNVAVPQRFSVADNDPDVGDTISVLGLRYRPVGGSTWTTLTQSSPTLFRDIAAGTFTATVDYEWQAQVTDAAGLLGPWSGSEYFTGAAVPPAPTITAPTSNATVSAPTGGVVAWSTANQDAYQLRVVADLAGTADPATVFYDSGIVADPAARSTTVDRPVNGRTEHTQVRVRYQGLWSNYGDVRNAVQYTPPAVPALGLAATPSAVQVTISHRAPVSTEPAVVYTDVYRRRSGATSSRRVATGRPAGALLDYSVGSGIDYEYQAVAVGANGSTSATAWLGAATVVVVPPTPVGTAGAYGVGVYGEGSFS